MEILFISFGVLLILGTPIAVALGVASVLTILAEINVSLVITAQSMYSTINSFSLMAVPFFILAGNLMGAAGISKRLVSFTNIFFGWIRGGLALVAIGSSMIFAAISGSCPATTAAIGSIMVPEMEKNGYPRQFSAATVASAGIVGQIIPPSIPMVTYAVIANCSIATLFLAGVGPGILCGIAMMIVAYFKSKKMNIPRIMKRISFKESLKITANSIWAILMPAIILGGIYSGVFTPTEAGAIACIYSIIIGIFVYKDMKWKDIFKVLANSASATAVIMLVLSTVSIFSFVLTRQHIPQAISDALLSMTSDKNILLLLFNIVLLICGMFLNSSAAIALLTPILLPVLLNAGVNIYHIGIIFIVNMGIGMITPPVGSCLYVATNISKLKFQEVVKGCIPYLIALLVVMALVTYIEPISLFLIR